MCNSALYSGGNIVPIEPVSPIEPISPRWCVVKIDKSDVLNIRTAPSENSKKIGELPYLETDLLIEECISNKYNQKWCKLKQAFVDTKAWVSKKFISNRYKDCVRFQEKQYQGLTFKTIAPDDSVTLWMGRGERFPKIQIPHYKSISIYSCMKNKNGEEWCWVNVEYKKNKSKEEKKLNNSSTISLSQMKHQKGWLPKETIEPIINDCLTAVRLKVDRDKIHKLCLNDGIKYEREKEYDHATIAYFYAQEFTKIANFYNERKLHGINDNYYQLIAFAYRKLGDTKKADRILNNYCSWNIEDDRKIQNIYNLYIKNYPEDKYLAENSLCGLGGDILPTFEQKDLLNKCIKFINSNKKFTKDALYQKCYGALESFSSTRNYKLATIAMFVDNIEPEKRIYASYYKNYKNNVFMQAWLLTQYRYI